MSKKKKKQSAGAITSAEALRQFWEHRQQARIAKLEKPEEAAVDPLEDARHKAKLAEEKNKQNEIKRKKAVFY